MRWLLFLTVLLTVAFTPAGRETQQRRQVSKAIEGAVTYLNWWLFENDSFGSLKTVVLKQN
jgi:hypothetical protein